MENVRHDLADRSSGANAARPSNRPADDGHHDDHRIASGRHDNRRNDDDRHNDNDHDDCYDHRHDDYNDYDDNDSAPRELPRVLPGLLHSAAAAR